MRNETWSVVNVPTWPLDKAEICAVVRPGIDSGCIRASCAESSFENSDAFRALISSELKVAMSTVLRGRLGLGTLIAPDPLIGVVAIFLRLELT